MTKKHQVTSTPAIYHIFLHYAFPNQGISFGIESASFKVAAALLIVR